MSSITHWEKDRRYEFHHQATMRICGHLRTDEALHAILLYLREEMPVEKVFLNFFEVQLKSFRTIAIAEREGGRETDLLVPMSPASMKELQEHGEEFRQRKDNFAWLFDDDPFNKKPAVHDYFSFHKIRVNSMLVMPLSLGPQMLGGGSIFLITNGVDRFTPKDAELLSLLKEPFAIALSNALQHREVLRLKNVLADDNRYLTRELQRVAGDEIIGSDFGLRSVMQHVAKVAPTDSPVLLSGETGAGKDVIANAIHLASPRRDGPFIPVNCGAIPESLIDSELFGHEKGAFTGALAQQRGRFERAHKGTIMLDEIGEMPLDVQVRLLRVLQNQEIERVGGAERIRVDIRVIAATNKDLAAQVKSGRFREDLFFRLNVFPIAVPPLRERTSDIPALVKHFIEKKARQLKVAHAPKLADGAIDALMAYDWPGNIRELENCIERAMILRREGQITVSDLGMPSKSSGETGQGKDPQPLDIDAAMARHITRVLEMTKGKIHGAGGAGELLGMNPNTLRSRMRKLGIAIEKPEKNK